MVPHQPPPPCLPHPQAFERQVDALSRQLAQAEQGSEDAAREREVLLEELRAAQQVGGWGGKLVADG